MIQEYCKCCNTFWYHFLSVPLYKCSKNVHIKAHMMKTSKNFHNLPNDDASSQRLISNHKELFSQNKTSTSQKTSPKGVSASKCEMGISLNLNLNKPKSWQTNLVCLLEFRFVCQNFGLFVSILVCLPAFWFVCQHFGFFASILVNQIADKQHNLTKRKKIDLYKCEQS